MTNYKFDPNTAARGIDVSHWQGTFDFSKAKAKNIKFVIHKVCDVGYSPFYDSKVNENYTKIKKEGLVFGGYAWLDPLYDAKKQAQFYLNWVKDHPTDIIAMDFEDSAFISATDYLYKAQVWLETIENALNIKPVVYTAEWFMQKFNRNKTGWFSKYPGWFASYRTLYPPVVPREWDNQWTFWQYSDTGSYPYYQKLEPGLGKTYGSSGAGLDMNYFFGTYSDLLNFIKNGSTPTVPPKPEPPIVIPGTPLYQAKCTASLGLRVRKGPGLNYTQIRSLKYNDIVDVYEERAGWLKISPTSEEWCSKDYLVRISIPTPPTNNGEVLFKAKCIAHALTILPDPKPGGHIIGYLVTNDVRNVYEVKNNYYKIEKDRNSWVNGKYMEKL